MVRHPVALAVPKKNVAHLTEPTYSWNAESEIKSAASVDYTYDGDGNRVQKSNGKIYWYGAGTEILDESDSSGNFTDEYVFFGGKRVAHRNVSSGSIYYYAEDFLGTSRSITTSTGTLCYDADFYPYGGERVVTNTCAQNYKFEGKERDTETGNDDFGARYYNSRLGRWLSADWSSVPAPVPYANLTNPQTLNLYAMVRDNPETFADLDGHDGDGSGDSGGSSSASTSSSTSSTTQPPQQQPPAPPPPPPSQTGQNSGTGQNQTPQPSWDKTKPLPDDPSKLGPAWKPDEKHDPDGKSGDKRYTNDKGDKLDWHKGVPEKPGEQGKDHWHWVPNGQKDKTHYHPGDTVKRQILGGIYIGGAGYIIYRVIRMLPSLTPWTWETIPLNAATP
jgi:RHS repeat-associated protein